MAWIKMDSGLRRHPKVVRIASAIKADKLRVVGGLHAVWSVFDEHSTDGVLHGYTVEMMDEEIGWAGFCDAMVAVGWLHQAGDSGLEMPEFSTHNGQSAKRRAQDAGRKKASRQSVRETSASSADKKRTREEKRREDKTPVVPLRFSEFWDAYPNSRRVGKAKCMEVWLSRGFTEVADQILLHVEAMKLTPQWLEAGGKFIPSSLTYLNQRRFEDGLPDVAKLKVAI